MYDACMGLRGTRFDYIVLKSSPGVPRGKASIHTH